MPPRLGHTGPSLNQVCDSVLPHEKLLLRQLVCVILLGLKGVHVLHFPALLQLPVELTQPLKGLDQPVVDRGSVLRRLVLGGGNEPRDNWGRYHHRPLLVAEVADVELDDVGLAFLLLAQLLQLAPVLHLLLRAHLGPVRILDPRQRGLGHLGLLHRVGTHLLHSGHGELQHRVLDHPLTNLHLFPLEERHYADADAAAKRDGKDGNSDLNKRTHCVVHRLWRQWQEHRAVRACFVCIVRVPVTILTSTLHRTSIRWTAYPVIAAMDELRTAF
mmetsp:Transcript_14748/g.29575  ORF Transcript_14748/g.29575 Transcript_14748/m.29575 type:complete len:273 (-) Transcript_14748:307-1125(-)